MSIICGIIDIYYRHLYINSYLIRHLEIVHVLDVFLFTGKHRWQLTYNLGLLHLLDVFQLTAKIRRRIDIYYRRVSVDV